jgi:RsiW-degrading membrane proteinase PrsW (M82 family)
MTIFRWIIGVIAALMALGGIVSFGVYVAAGIDLWMERARNFRRWFSSAVLLWFNVEIWRSVVLIIINW